MARDAQAVLPAAAEAVCVDEPLVGLAGAREQVSHEADSVLGGDAHVLEGLARRLVPLAGERGLLGAVCLEGAQLLLAQGLVCQAEGALGVLAEALLRSLGPHEGGRPVNNLVYQLLCHGDHGHGGDHAKQDDAYAHDVMQKTPAATRQTANAMREAMGERLGFSTESLPALAMRSS